MSYIVVKNDFRTILHLCKVDSKTLHLMYQTLRPKRYKLKEG